MVCRGLRTICTEVMQLFKNRVFVKTGAEGMYCGAIPELGLGIALKCDDGATRGAEVMMAAVLKTLLPIDDGRELQPWLSRALYNFAGQAVGQFRAARLQRID